VTPGTACASGSPALPAQSELGYNGLCPLCCKSQIQVFIDTADIIHLMLRNSKLLYNIRVLKRKKKNTTFLVVCTVLAQFNYGIQYLPHL
jgi:hypothetical protein